MFVIAEVASISISVYCALHHRALNLCLHGVFRPISCECGELALNQLRKKRIAVYIVQVIGKA